jgi:membrane associated rhomboid family serine protease
MMVQDNNDSTGTPPDPFKHSDNIIQLSKKREEYKPIPSKVPMFNVPFATKYLMATLVFIHLIVSYGHALLSVLPDQIWWVYNFGFLPNAMMNSEYATILTPLTPITYALLHGSWLHLGSNILMLAAFGAALEKNYSSKMMMLIFWGSSIFAALLHFLFDMHGINPVIGASGGISGLFGAALIMLKSQQRLNQNNSLMPIIAVWIGITILFGFIGAPDGSIVAWVAHIGGFLGGLGLMWFITRPKKLV